MEAAGINLLPLLWHSIYLILAKPRSKPILCGFFHEKWNPAGLIELGSALSFCGSIPTPGIVSRLAERIRIRRRF
jgi:hypothetical protein